MRFDAVIEPPGGIVVPFDVREVFGAGRVPVRVVVNGATEYRTTIVKMHGQWLFPLRRDIREQAGVDVGERVTLDVERDEEERTIEAPAELVAALDADARAFFDSLSFTHRKEYVQWVESAKREETRRNRIEKAAQMLRDRVRHP